MPKKSASIDGFVPRTSGRSIGDIHKTSLGRSDSKTTLDKGDETSRPITTADLKKNRKSISRSEIDDSLKGIEDEEKQAPRKGLFRRKQKQPKSRRRKIIGRIIKLLLILAILAGAYLGFKAITASTAIFKGNFFGIFQTKPLKMDTNGRTNILVFGTSGSIEDSRHEGANLTDTLLVLSIDQKKKNAYMVSLPRDLYVDYGATCAEGYQGKINSMYDCYSEQGKNEQAGAKALQKKAAQVTGLTMQYSAHVNWAVLVKSIDAVGGVSVDVEGDGSCAFLGMPEGSIVDANMRIRYTPGKHKMKGETALRFSRARGDKAPNCGLDRGDFNRQLNQQKVLKALREKAASGETLTNLGKVTGLIDALGQNLRTDFDTSEIQTLMGLAKDIPSDKITSIDLYDKENAVIGSGNIPNAGSIQVPTAGTYEYSGIRSFIRKKITSNDITREDARVALFNGSGATGYVKKRETALQKQGFNITTADNAPVGKYARVEIYDFSDGEKPKTKAKLEALYNVKVKKGTPPVYVAADTEFVIIYGKATKY